MTPRRRIGLIGEGHFGVVYHERELLLQRDVAVKYLPLTFVGLDREAFVEEARAMQECRHENVVEVLSADFEDRHGLIVMEYLRDGSVLKKFRGEPVPVGRVIEIMEDVARGVAHVHSMGLLHRDVKPSNILLTDLGSAKVSDFGLTRSAADVAGDGYEAHWPPEAFLTGINDEVSEVYTLGVTMFRLLVGEAAFSRMDASIDDIDRWFAVSQGRIPNFALLGLHVPQRTLAALRRALDPDPARRTSTATAFRQDLERARPKVSWKPPTSDHGLREWGGVDRSTGRMWRAELCMTGSISFRLASGLKAMRKVDELQGSTVAATEAFARKRMNRVSMLGK